MNTVLTVLVDKYRNSGSPIQTGFPESRDRLFPVPLNKTILLYWNAVFVMNNHHIMYCRWQLRKSTRPSTVGVAAIWKKPRKEWSNEWDKQRKMIASNLFGVVKIVVESISFHHNKSRLYGNEWDAIVNKRPRWTHRKQPKANRTHQLW